MRRSLVMATLCACTVALFASGAFATHGPDAEVTVGSNDAVMLQNKQNEPWVAINPANTSQLAAGANDNIDLEGCNNGSDNTCPFTDGVGVSGVYFSTGGASWTQPTYSGYSFRTCPGVPGSADSFTPTQPGPIGTLPGYFANRLVSDGDPALAFGPKLAAGALTLWLARCSYTALGSRPVTENSTVGVRSRPGEP